MKYFIRECIKTFPIALVLALVCLPILPGHEGLVGSILKVLHIAISGAMWGTLFYLLLGDK
jgi:hypothetical protein